MNILLLAFALPIAVIILSIVLQKILKCPLLVSATFFAIFLIVTYAVFDSSFLVFAILYAILAYVTAVLTRLICNIIARFNLNSDCNCICESDRNSNNCTQRSSNCNVSTGTWCCTTRNTPRIGINQISANALANNGRVCTCNRGGNIENDPVIILTNSNDIINGNETGDSGRNRRNNVNCGCSCNRR